MSFDAMKNFVNLPVFSDSLLGEKIFDASDFHLSFLLAELL